MGLVQIIWRPFQNFDHLDQKTSYLFWIFEVETIQTVLIDFENGNLNINRKFTFLWNFSKSQMRLVPKGSKSPKISYLESELISVP